MLVAHTLTLLARLMSLCFAKREMALAVVGETAIFNVDRKIPGAPQSYLFMQGEGREPIKFRMKNSTVIPGAGPAVREARLEERMTLADLASKLAMDSTQLSKYETSKHAISYALLCRLAKALNRPADKLIISASKFFLQAAEMESKDVGFLKNAIRIISGQKS